MPNVWLELEEAAAELNPHKPPPKARLGYILGGTKVIDVDGDPSRVYVHSVGGGWYGRYLHKGRIRTTPIEDVWGTPVLLGKDELGYDCILGIDSSQSAGILINRRPDIQTPQHTHSLADLIELASNVLPPLPNYILIGNDEGEYQALPIAVALAGIVAELEDLVGFDPDDILTSDGEVLVSDGNVLVSED